jgi:hypothetical protein
VSRAATPTPVEQARDDLDRRLGGPPVFDPPEKWTLSSSWHRAQAAPAECGPVTPAEFHVLMGHPDRDGLGDGHRVTFAIFEGELRAECDCQAFRFEEWCAHVAYLWWRWSARGNLAVTDLDTEKTYLWPPAWLSIGSGGDPQ